VSNRIWEYVKDLGNNKFLLEGVPDEEIEMAEKEAERLQQAFHAALVKLGSAPDSIEFGQFTDGLKMSEAGDANVGVYSLKETRKMGKVFTNVKDRNTILWCAGSTNEADMPDLVVAMSYHGKVSSYCNSNLGQYDDGDFSFVKVGRANREKYKVYRTIDVIHEDGSKGKMKLVRKPFCGAAKHPYVILKSPGPISMLKDLDISWGNAPDDYVVVLFKGARNKRDVDAFLKSGKFDTKAREDAYGTIQANSAYKQKFGKEFARKMNDDLEQIQPKPYKWIVRDGKVLPYNAGGKETRDLESYDYSMARISNSKQSIRKALSLIIRYAKGNFFDNINFKVVTSLNSSMSKFTKEVYEHLGDIDLVKSQGFLKSMQSLAGEVSSAVSGWNDEFSVLEEEANNLLGYSEDGEPVMAAIADIVTRDPVKFARALSDIDFDHMLHRELHAQHPELSDYSINMFNRRWTGIYHAIEAHSKELAIRTEEAEKLQERVNAIKEQFEEALEK